MATPAAPSDFLRSFLLKQKMLLTRYADDALLSVIKPFMTKTDEEELK